jgi:hypothetical protein
MSVDGAALRNRVKLKIIDFSIDYEVLTRRLIARPVTTV